MADETMVQKKERRHHNPDDIIDGKPKWSNVVIVRDMLGSNNRMLNVDRLNPSRAEIEELDENYGDDAGKAEISSGFSTNSLQQILFSLLLI